MKRSACLFLTLALLLPTGCGKPPADPPVPKTVAPAPVEPAADIAVEVEPLPETYRYITLRRATGDREIVFLKSLPGGAEAWIWQEAEWQAHPDPEGLLHDPDYEVVTIEERTGDWRPRRRVTGS